MRLMILAGLALLFANSAHSREWELKVNQIESPISLDPFEKTWRKAETMELLLMPQTIAPPGGGGAVKKVWIKVLQCRREIFFRLEWEDKTVDDYPSPAEKFTDAVALQFPAQPGTWPSPFMGDKENAVVIWRWSAGAQKDMDQGYQTSRAYRPRTTADLYAFADDTTFLTGEGAGNILSKRRRQSGVEQLAAKGFGTLTFTNDQPVEGRGVWKKGRWHVVFKRELNGTPDFWSGARLPFAAAVWDGNSQERDGMKSVSVWQILSLPGAPFHSNESTVERGHQVFSRYGCATCHGKGGLGGVPNPNAQTNPVPPLNRVKEGFSRAELQNVIFKGREPQRADSEGAPPPFKMNGWEVVMSQEEVTTLIDYLFSLMPENVEEW